jgi:hypothetical protein
MRNYVRAARGGTGQKSVELSERLKLVLTVEPDGQISLHT